MNPSTLEKDDSLSLRSGRRSLSRQVLVFAALLPLAGLVALLAWGMIKAGGKPGGLGINSKLGEVKVRQVSAREFSLTLFSGSTLNLRELRGKVVMVDFWASWCPPCREEAPTLARVYLEYKDKGVEFVGVDIWDNEKDARSYVRQYGITYPNGLDAKGSITIDYGVTGIPEKYFIGREGVLVKKFVGPMNDAQLRAVLDGLLGAQ